MTHQRRNRLPALFRLLVPALAALLPLLALGGGAPPTAQAALPPAQADATRPSDTAETLIIRVYFSDAAERDRLAVELGAEEYATTGGYLTLWETRETYDKLVARGLRVEIDEAQTAIINRPIQFGESSPDTFFGGYRTVEENFAYMDTLVGLYPNMAEKIDIGDTWCKTHPGQCTQPNSWNGYDLWVLHITNRDIPGPKPVFWFESGIHSREIATPEMATRFMSWLLDGYNTDPDARWLVDHHDIWVMPMVNPDGHHIVENGENTPRMQRKNADKDDGCTTFLSLGTDLNRNFPFKWACCGGSSGQSCSETYRGPSAGSEEETVAVLNKIRALVPDQRGPLDTDPAPLTTTGIYQSMHTVAELNLYPWGWTGTGSPNNLEMSNIARHMSAANAYPSGNTYQACQPPNCLYGVDGDTMDWGYGELGIPSFTTELGGSGFFPSFAEIPGLWNENRGMLIYLAKIARTPYLLSRGPDLSVASASTPITVTQGQTAPLLATANFVWTANQFQQNVGAAEYYIDTPPWNGGTGIPMQPVDGNFNSPTEQVQATVDSTGLTPGRHILMVRARGATDHMGNQTWGAVSARFIDVLAGGTPTNTVTGTPPTNSPTRTPTQTRTPTNTVPATNTPTATNTVPVPAGCNITPITIPDSGPGVPYPSLISYSAGGTILDVNVTLNDVSHTYPDDVDILLVGPAGQSVILMSDAGGSNDVTDVDLTFDDEATATLPDSAQIVTGSYDPTNYLTGDTFPAPAPGGPYGTTMSVFDGTNPNGNWSLYVVDDLGGDEGQIASGWCVDIQTSGGATATPTSTVTPIPPSVTATSTGTNTPVPPSATPTLPDGTPTNTGTPTAIVTACPLQFTDVPETNTFYPFVRCLACQGIINGYPCGGDFEPCDPDNNPYFRPNNPVTRGQIAKIVSLSAGFNEVVPPTQQSFEDVVYGSPFWEYVERLYSRSIIGGYQCGVDPAEPCVPPDNLPYFRPNAGATRGQLVKIASESAGFTDVIPETQYTFTDVPPGHTFWIYIERLLLNRPDAIAGYPCGSPGEPCDSENRPYFRPNNGVTRGQASKIVSNTFFPGCNPPRPEE
jgi:carboxypeptidase T